MKALTVKTNLHKTLAYLPRSMNSCSKGWLDGIVAMATVGMALMVI